MPDTQGHKALKKTPKPWNSTIVPLPLLSLGADCQNPQFLSQEASPGLYKESLWVCWPSAGTVTALPVWWKKGRREHKHFPLCSRTISHRNHPTGVTTQAWGKLPDKATQSQSPQPSLPRFTMMSPKPPAVCLSNRNKWLGTTNCKIINMSGEVTS